MTEMRDHRGWITRWDPDDPQFWASDGRRIARRNLALSVFAEHIGFCIWVLWTVIRSGLSTVVHASWWTGTMRNITYTDPGGGALAAIVGTLEQVAICTVISVPIAVLVGIYLVEYGRGPFAKVTTFMVDIMTGIPSIVAGLFIYALVVETFNLPKTGWLISLALIILMVPVIVRTTEEILKLVPNNLREASLALGTPTWKTIVQVVLPVACGGIVTGIVLSLARAAGETAPLLLTALGNEFFNFKLNEPMSSLPTQIYNYAKSPYSDSHTKAWGSSLVLIIVIGSLSLLTRVLTRKTKQAR